MDVIGSVPLTERLGSEPGERRRGPSERRKRRRAAGGGAAAERGNLGLTSYSVRVQELGMGL
jgi:hypothetical protein